MKIGKLKKLEEELKQLRADHRSLGKRIEKMESDIYKLTGVEEDAKEFSYNRPLQIEQIDEKTEQKVEKEKNENNKSSSLKSKNWEFKIGGTWLNRLGVIAVVLGILFFVKYSFDYWIGPTGRVILGLISGLVMTIGGEKLRSKYFGYAQGLLGGGSLVLFISIYVGQHTYNLIPDITAFLAMIIIMAYTVFMAVRHNSLPIGIFGVISGYLIPFLVGIDISLTALFVYLGLMTMGVLAISYFQQWTSFKYMGYLLNKLIFAFISLGYLYSPDKAETLPLLMSYLIFSFLLYLGAATIYNIRYRIKSSFWDWALISLNGLSFFFWSYLILDSTWIDDYMGFYALLVALVYIYLGKMAYNLFSKDKGQVYSLWSVALVLITLAIPLQLEGGWIGLGWLLEAVGLAYIANRLKIEEIMYAGLFVMSGGILNGYQQLSLLDKTDPFFFNFATVLMIAAIAVLVTIIKLVDDKDILVGLKAGLLLHIFLFMSIENHYFFKFKDISYYLSPEQLSLSGLWLLYALGIFGFAIRNKDAQLRYVSLGLMMITIAKAFLIDLASLEIIFKIILFIILGGVLLAISYYYHRKGDEFFSGKNEEEKI